MDNMSKNEDVLTFSGFPNDNILYLELAGISYKDIAYRIARPPQRVTVIEYVTEGRGTLIVNGKKYAVPPGSVYIAPSWQSHEYYSDSRDPWVKYWVNVAGPLVDSLRKIYGIEHHYVFPDAVDAGKVLMETIETLRDMPEKEVRSYMARQILQVIQLLSDRVATEEAYTQSPVTEAMITFMRKRITGPMPELQEIADAANRSPSQAIRIFRNDMKITPYRWLLIEKIHTSCSVLTCTGKCIRDIAYMFGFRDEFYFSRLFRQIVGISPNTYRKQQGTRVNGSPSKELLT